GTAACGGWTNGTMVTGRPFASVKRFGVGMTKSFAGPGAGGCCFCHAPIAVDDAVIAAAIAAPSANAPSTRRDVNGCRLIVLLIAPPACFSRRHRLYPA